MHHYLFIHSHINEYWGCFQFLYYRQCCHEHSFPCLTLSLRTIIVFVHFYPHYPRFCHLVETQRGKKYIFPFTSNLKENKTMGLKKKCCIHGNSDMVQIKRKTNGSLKSEKKSIKVICILVLWLLRYSPMLNK